MGRFLRGILLGIGVALLFAPMRGEELRRLLSERLQRVRGYIPEKTELNQYSQQVSGRVSQTASDLKDYAAQATAQVKDTASNLGTIAQQAGSSVKETASNLGTVAQQAGSDVKSTVSTLSSTAQDVAQQATAKVQDTVSTLSSTAQNVAQQATAKAKDAVNTVSSAAQQTTAKAQDVAQQTTAKVQDTASNVSQTVQDKAQQVTAKVQNTGNTAADTAKQVAAKAQQSVQSTTAATVNAATNVSTAPTTGNSLSTIPGIEPEIQGKLEAQGVYTTQQLLEQTTTKDERANLAQKATMSIHMLKTLADRADLMRLQGITADIATMLEEAGVDGSKDLRRRNPEHLYTTLMEAQQSGKSAYTTPGLDQITQWIAEAMALTSSNQE